MRRIRKNSRAIVIKLPNPNPALTTHANVGSVVDSDIEDDEEVLGEFLAARLENSTRSNYKSGLRSVMRLLNSCSRDGADAIRNGDLAIPMSDTVWHAWLTESKKPINDGGKVRAPSTVFGFIDAVKSAHTEKNARLSENVYIHAHQEVRRGLNPSCDRKALWQPPRGSIIYFHEHLRETL
jgi:hypothetical protein